MFRWIFSQDTEEIAELFVMLIVVFMSELKNKGDDTLRDEIKNFKHIKYFSGKFEPRYGVVGYKFCFDGPLREFFFDIEDDRKMGGTISLHITGEDGRYYGFGLGCDLLTGRVTVGASDSMAVNINGKRATRKARKLCKVFARKYRGAANGNLVDWQRVLMDKM